MGCEKMIVQMRDTDDERSHDKSNSPSPPLDVEAVSQLLICHPEFISGFRN